MERVRLDSDCELARLALLSVKKASAMAFEASDRTPPTVSSRALLEAASTLLAGAYNALLELERSLCGS